MTVLKNYPGEYELISPTVSILAQPSVAVVDDNVDFNGTRDVAEAYLSYLYEDDAQRLAAENGYRPSNQEILKEYEDTFDLTMTLWSIEILEAGIRRTKIILMMMPGSMRYITTRRRGKYEKTIP